VKSQKARDVAYGRRAGRWANDQAPSLDKLRRTHTADWPEHDLPDRGPSTPAEWEGLARMAAARRAAGQPLTNNDELALTRYPHP
jgi:hypothetical protein